MFGHRETDASNYRLSPTVTLERKDEHRTSFMIKKSKYVQELIKKETAKNYSAAQIFHAIRGAGTEASTSLPDAAGGGFTNARITSPL